MCVSLSAGCFCIRSFVLSCVYLSGCLCVRVCTCMAYVWSMCSCVCVCVCVCACVCVNRYLSRRLCERDLTDGVHVRASVEVCEAVANLNTQAHTHTRTSCDVTWGVPSATCSPCIKTRPPPPRRLKIPPAWFSRPMQVRIQYFRLSPGYIRYDLSLLSGGASRVVIIAVSVVAGLVFVGVVVAAVLCFRRR